MPYKKSTGEHKTWKQFLEEWKRGMREVTPLQQATTIQLGQIVSAIGVIWGIIFSIGLKYYWMAAILVGGIIVLGVQYLGNWQKKQVLLEIEKVTKEAMENEISEGSNETLLQIN